MREPPREITRDGGHAERFEYDPQGNLQWVAVRAADGGESRLDSVCDKRALAFTNAQGERTEISFSPTGKLVGVRAGERTIVQFDYDTEDRLVAARYDSGAWESFGYDKQGRVTAYRRSGREGASHGEAEGIELTYDTEGRVTGMRNPTVGAVTITTTGREVSVKSAGNLLRLQLDKAGRPILLKGPDGLTARYKYAANGALSAIEAQRAKHKAQVVFQEGRPVEIQDFSGAKTRFGYHPNGLPASVTDAAGGRFSYRYDERERLARIDLPDGRCTEIVYAGGDDLIGKPRTHRCQKGGGS